MKIFSLDKALLAIHAAILTVFVGLLLLQAFNSLGWRMEHDTPLLHYAGFLIDEHGLVPYKDIFETSMPGTFAFHYLVGALFGYGDLAFRLVDLALLGALLVATFWFMARFGRLPALWAVVLFGVAYLGEGQDMSLQRDYIGIVPIAFSLLAIPGRISAAVHLGRFAIVGLLFGLSALIKPHLVIGLPIVFGALVTFRWHSKNKSLLDLVYCGAVCAASFLVPFLIAVFWLGSSSALSHFIDIYSQYLPMHSAVAGSNKNLTGISHVRYLVEGTLGLGGYSALFVCSLFAYYRASIYDNLDKVLVITTTSLFLCTAAYATYPTIAGKFWDYHYMPFAYFCSISSALCLFSWPDFSASSSLPCFRKALPLIILIGAVTLQGLLPRGVFRALSDLQSGSEAHAPKGGRVDEIADWLKSRLRPGDTVQPLDWTGGSIHGMLLSEAKLATRFMYDYHFYHHVSSAYTLRLRESFMGQLHEAAPRFIIEVHEDKPWVSGVDTTREFPELRMFLEGYYEVVYRGDGYHIYEQKADARSEAGQQVAPAGRSCLGTVGPDTGFGHNDDRLIAAGRGIRSGARSTKRSPARSSSSGLKPGSPRPSSRPLGQWISCYTARLRRPRSAWLNAAPGRKPDNGCRAVVDGR